MSSGTNGKPKIKKTMSEKKLFQNLSSIPISSLRCLKDGEDITYFTSTQDVLTLDTQQSPQLKQSTLEPQSTKPEPVKVNTVTPLVEVIQPSLRPGIVSVNVPQPTNVFARKSGEYKVLVSWQIASGYKIEKFEIYVWKEYCAVNWLKYGECDGHRKEFVLRNLETSVNMKIHVEAVNGNDVSDHGISNTICL